MASGTTAQPSNVNFPISESPQKQGKPGSPLKAPHLPFRRISLPTAPSLLHRVSVVSVASFDPFPEEGVDESPRSSRVPFKVANGKGPGRPISSVESPRRRTRARRESSVKPADDGQAPKRRKVVHEFYETEKAYVDGLELIYSHFLTPIIVSLDTPEPLLNRLALTSIFSNFIDIWNLHRSFLSALTSLLEPITQNEIPAASSSKSPAENVIPSPNLSPLLLAHFPYLSLYTPFVTAFPSTISALNELITPPSTTRASPQYNHRFAVFLTAQEADPRCGKLKLRDWLLTIVQRCPRYLLLLKDLINSINKEDPEHAQLTAVHTLVSKITLSLNSSLHTHAQTLALLALQKSTPNLPFQLITPGRTLLKRGSLLQVERSGNPVEREFLLFSDCMIWLAVADSSGSSWDWSWSGSGGSGSGSGVSQSSHNTPVANSKLAAAMERPPMTRTRSKSEAELSTLKMEANPSSSSDPDSPSFQGAEVAELPSTPVIPRRVTRMKSNLHSGTPPSMAKRHPSTDDKWVYKGRVELVDVQVVISHALEDERRFEVLSPEGSFVLYAPSEEERDEWTTEIRRAKAQLLVSLNITNPNSTLTSSTSNNHVRRALQALPYPPSDERLATLHASTSLDVFSSSAHGNGNGNSKVKAGKKDKARRGISAERRRKVEHWVPAIWIPDGKTSSCMRCGRMFGWRRRRHHCRLCGRCVCAGCSGRTFFISDANSKSSSSSKPARACDACYETVFPLIDPPESEHHGLGEGFRANNEVRASDSIPSLSHLPSWLSMPALPVQHQPQALMAIDLNSSQDVSLDAGKINDVESAGEEKERRARLRMKSHQRLRSYQQILEDFQEQARVMKKEPPNDPGEDGQGLDGEEEDKFDGVDDEDDAKGEDQDQIDSDMWFTPTHSLASSPVSSPRKQRREDTARRSKRFSLPAIALHTTSVTARTTEIGADTSNPALSRESSGEQPPSAGGGMGRSRRFSLVLAGRNSYALDGNGIQGKSMGDMDSASSGDLARGVAAARLSELLGRKTSAHGRV